MDRPLALVGVLLLVAGCARAVVTAPAPPVAVGWEETGEASWYGHPYHGRRTASGEVYDMAQMTAAHRTLPFGAWILVENRLNGRTTEVRVTARGPFVGDRLLDLSAAAARVLGAIGPGVIPVRLRVIALAGGASRVAAGGAFTVQVAAFTTEDRARALRDQIEPEWPGARVERAAVAGQTYYRVRVGRYVTRGEAARAAERLAAAGHTAVVAGE
ncbi:MAG: septal ring lytic transglycosylase RlpA family protein [candidate division NC10 bacterium]